MRHRIAGYQLSRDAEDRRALRRNLAIALFTYGQITTTLPKAKSVQPFVERLITFARKGDLASRRRVIADLGNDRIIVKGEDDPDVKRNKYGELVDGPRLVKRLFDEIGPRYSDRPGGYTRIIKLARHRIGDGSSLVVLQLVSKDDTGPQVSGKRATRFRKAQRRAEFANKVRKGKEEAGAAAAEAPKA